MIRNTKKHLLVVVTGLVLLMLAACGGGGGSTASLSGTDWHLVSLDGSSPIEAESVTITLHFDEAELSGRSGCNQYGGGYTLSDDDDITVSNLFMTEMACLDPEGVMEQEQVYLEILGGATGWEVDNGQLYIYDEPGRTLLFDANGE